VALYGSPVFGFDLPTHLEIMTHSESVHLYAELETGILALPTDTGGLETSTDSWSPLLITVVIIMLMLMLFIILITIDHWFINAKWIILMLLNC
jgi:hypothetical protein